MEQINKNLLIVNLQMLYHEELEPWIHRIFPHVQVIKFYCRVWAYSGILPPARGRDSEDWGRTPYIYRNLRTDQLRNSKQIAMKEAVPTVPTVCLIEYFPYEKELQELEIKKIHESLVIVDFTGISLVDEEWVRQQLPTVEEIQIICRRWNFTEEYRTKWETLPVQVRFVSSLELSNVYDTIRNDKSPHPRVIFIERRTEIYASFREDAKIQQNQEDSYEKQIYTKMEEID